MARTLGTVGHYELLRQIGRGGMATVFVARQLGLDRLVAIKLLTGVQLHDEQVARRFLRESQLVAKLNHERIVTVHDFFEQDGTPYISMEYLPRGSLRQYIGKLSIEQSLLVIEDLLDGMAW